MISRLQLLSGTDLVLTPNVSVRHPSITDILSINHGFYSEDYYWAYVSSILSDPYDFMVFLDDNHIDYESVSAFRVFALRWADTKAKAMKNKKGAAAFDFLNESLAYFFGPRQFDFETYEGRQIMIDRQDHRWFMTDEMFDMASQFITAINCMERTDKIKPATPSAKRILIEDMRSEQKRRARNKKPPERTEHIGDALAVVLSGGAGTITPSNLHNTHIYQLLTTARAVQKQMVVQAMLNGIYTGMMKADKISDNDLRWA